VSSSGESERERKIYSIRGLDPRLYEEFSRLARTLGVSVGELMNEAMRMTIAALEAGKDVGRGVKMVVKGVLELLKIPVEAAKDIIEKSVNVDIVSGVDELEIGRSDLEAAPKPVLFINMKRLVIADDVDPKLVEEKIAGIKLVDEVSIPKTIPKLLIARKCSMVRKIVVRG